jgi:hypothetical protein
MNPSSSGWIPKFESVIEKHQDRYSDFSLLYSDLKRTGFVYGINTEVVPFILSEHSLSDDEKAKINLFTALYYTYRLERNSSFEQFLEDLFAFYDTLRVAHLSFLGKLLSGKTTISKLEKLIDSRVYLEDNVISKTFNSIITNSLLFIDVLLFKRYLNDSVGIKTYAYNLEYLAIHVTYHALNSKEKNKKDEKLAELFGSSLTFINPDTQSYDGSYRELLLKERPTCENAYLLDMACLTVWEDHSLDYKESKFIFSIGKDMNCSNKTVTTSLEDVAHFFEKNAKIVPFLKDNNLAIQFYDSMSKVVNKLILRNSKRLQKELSESAELVALLSKSTLRDLTKEEKKKVQNQLIDIFKSIPSLAIFILPGGAVLLPIFIKLVPKLLPSSFDENRVEKSEENE